MAIKDYITSEAKISKDKVLFLLKDEKSITQALISVPKEMEFEVQNQLISEKADLCQHFGCTDLSAVKMQSIYG